MIILNLSDSIIKSLSPNELTILKFVYEHGEEILTMSIQEMSRQVSYSSATILRFCKKLGYSGFAELKYVIRASIRDKKTDPAAAQTSNPLPAFSDELMMSGLCTNIEGTSKLLDEESLIQTFRYIDSGQPIYVWAPGGMTFIAAEYFEKLLLSIGRQKVYIISASRVLDHLLRTSAENAILILISTSGEYKPTIRFGKLANMNGIPIITISPYTNNNLASLSTVSFRFFSPQRENSGADLTPRLPVFYIINMIIQCYLQYRRITDGIHPSQEVDRDTPI